MDRDINVKYLFLIPKRGKGSRSLNMNSGHRRKQIYGRERLEKNLGIDNLGTYVDALGGVGDRVPPFPIEEQFEWSFSASGAWQILLRPAQRVSYFKISIRLSLLELLEP